MQRGVSTMAPWASVFVAAIAGCNMPNPAFDGDDGSGTETATSPIPTETDPGTGPETDTDPQTGTDTGPGTQTDPTFPGCEFAGGSPLEFVAGFAKPDCPPTFSKMYLEIDIDTVNEVPGIAMGQRCLDSECFSCDPNDLQPVGVPGLELVIDSWDALAELYVEQDFGPCMEVQATSYADVDGEFCTYQSMGLVSLDLEYGPVFVGINNSAPPTPLATELLQGQLPQTDGVYQTCGCDEYFQGYQKEIECCNATILDPTTYAMLFQGEHFELDVATSVDIGFVPWEFYVAQAEAVPSCENLGGEEETSWALVRLD